MRLSIADACQPNGADLVIQSDFDASTGSDDAESQGYRAVRLARVTLQSFKAPLHYRTRAAIARISGSVCVNQLAMMFGGANFAKACADSIPRTRALSSSKGAGI